MTNNELFDSIPFLLKPLFENRYPWQALGLLKEAMNGWLLTPPQGFRHLRKDVLGGEGVTIHESAVIDGPAILGTNTEIRPNAYLRGYVFCGEGCVIGNASELKHCILMDRVQVPHYNYVGDSVLGNRAHLGAGAILSNLKHDGKNVVLHGKSDLDSGLRKLGGILGDRANIGCGCVLNPGTVIGKDSATYPLLSLRGVYPKEAIIKDAHSIVKKR